MSNSERRDLANDPDTLTAYADAVCDRFEAAWKAGQRPRPEDYVGFLPDAERSALLCELIALEICYRRCAGESLRAEDFLVRFRALDPAWLSGLLGPPATRPSSDAACGARDFRQLGKFLLLKQLGRGGCGAVWRARDTELDRTVAVKIPDAALLAEPGVGARFRREAKAAARLCHPNIVTLFEIAQVGETPLLVMELVEGTDLHRHVERSGPLAVAAACACIRQAGLGLQHAHDHGMVHRDIKPANLLRTAAGDVKIADFGLVQLPRRPGDKGSSLTEPGCVMGTPDFMAPEQARDSRTADARSDIYGLGCTFYFLLTGRAPFPGGSVTEKMLRHLTDVPTPIEQLRPDVAPPIAAVLRRMMARHPADRFQTAAALVAALTAAIQTIAAPSYHAGAEQASNVWPAPAAIRDKAPGRAYYHWAAGFLLLGLGALTLLLAQPWNWFRASIGEPPALLSNTLDMKFALIRPGKFLMGSPDDEPSRLGGEGPRHEVEISRAFYLGVHEVTQHQFEAVMGNNPSHFTKEQGGGPDHPAEQITYPMAVAFCEQLSARPAEKRAGRVYRLPTEAEWEYACRAGSDSIFSFGDDYRDLVRHAWYVENAGGRTHAVGKLAPNAWGLYDMHGNVWEWCADWYDERYYQDGPARDPPGARAGQYRSLRGGGWGEFGDKQWCRAAARGRREPEFVANTIGLRIAFSPSADTR